MMSAIRTSDGERSAEGRSARSYAAWVSLYCGLVALLLIAVFLIHLRLVDPKDSGGRWIGFWFAAGCLTSLLGVIAGIQNFINDL